MLVTITVFTFNVLKISARSVHTYTIQQHEVSYLTETATNRSCFEWDSAHRCSPLDAHNSSCAHSPFNSHPKNPLTSFNFLFYLTHTSFSINFLIFLFLYIPPFFFHLLSTYYYYYYSLFSNSYIIFPFS